MPWDKSANCYAYACNWETPENGEHGAAVPGGRAGAAVYRTSSNKDSYADLLVQGILDDATTNQLTDVTTSRTITTLPDAGSGYLIAMLVNKERGFHFLRRDRITNLWSWKDGNFGKVETEVYDANGASKLLTVNDKTMTAICFGLHRKFYTPNWSDMEFVAYIGLTNINGMTVSGKLKPA